MKKTARFSLNRSSSVNMTSPSSTGTSREYGDGDSVSTDPPSRKSSVISSSRLLSHFSHQRFLINIPQPLPDDCDDPGDGSMAVDPLHTCTPLMTGAASPIHSESVMSNSPSAATLLPNTSTFTSRTKIGQLGKQKQVTLDPTKLAMPHQKSSESHDSSVSGMSFTTSSGTSADEQVSTFSLSATEQRSSFYKSPSKLLNKSFSSPVTPTQSNSDGSKSSWKKAFTVFKWEKSSVKRSSKDTPKPQTKEEDVDAIYRFLTCKKCLSGQPCNDPQCPGRDPNLLPTITKQDLIAEQRRLLMKRVEARTEKRN